MTRLQALNQYVRSALDYAYFYPIVVALGVCVRLLVALIFPVEGFSDYEWYMARAVELASGMGYQEQGYPTAYWPIGWPAILAAAYWATGSMLFAIVGLNVIAVLAIFYLLHWFARETTGSVEVGKIALLLYAVYPSHVAYSGVAASESVYTAFLMGALALLIGGRSKLWALMLSGLLFSASTLIKPQSLAFPVGAVVALLIVYRDVGMASAVKILVTVYLALAVVIAPWTLRNEDVLGHRVLVSTNGGGALLVGANDYMTGSAMDIRKTPVFAELGVPWEARVARQIELNAAKKDAALKWISEHTAEWISWMPIKVAKLWRGDSDGFWSLEESYPQHGEQVFLVKFINHVFYLTVLVASIAVAWISAIGLIRRDHVKARLSLLFLAPVFVSLMAAVFTGQTRYHFPAMPFLFLAASWFFWELLRKWSTPLPRDL